MKLLQLLTFTLLAFVSQRSLAFDMGALNQYLEPGASGAWTLTEQNGAAVFDNREADGALTYYYVGANAGEEGQREITVDVSILRSSGFSKAGLLYGFENEPRSYFMYTIDGENTLRLEYRSPDGWEERMSSTLSEVSSDKVTLSIREDGNLISLLVNGQERSSIGNDQTGRGGVGIVAAGIGTYSLNRFNISVRDQGAALQPEANPPVTDDSQNNAQVASITQNDSSTNGLPDGVLHVKPVEIIDKHGFEKPVRAASLLIPADWKFEGMVHWVINGCRQGTHIVYDAISPDGQTNLSLLPSTNVHWSQLGPSSNCTFLRVNKAEDLLQPVIDEVMQNATIVKTERSPELTAMNQQSVFQDVGFRSWMDHIVATVDHDRLGKRHRAAVLLYTNHTQMQMPMLNGPSESSFASALPIIFSAPKEQFNDYNVAQNLILQSYRLDPEWNARMNKHRKVMADDNRRTSANIAQINRNTNAEIAAIRAGTQANIAASNDRNHRRTLEMLTETQTVQGSNGPVRMPAGTVWETSGGSMFVSQNPSFNPSSIGIAARKLTPIR